MRRQWAVYWPPAGVDKFNKVKYGTPVEVKVRWNESSELFMNGKGEQQVSKAVVYLGLSDAADSPLTVEEQGVLWLGPDRGRTANPLAGLDTAHRQDPFKNRNAWSVVRIDETGTIKDDDFLITAYL